MTKRFKRNLYNQRVLIFMSAPLILHLLFFSYLPMWGIIISFMDYKPLKGIFSSDLKDNISNFFKTWDISFLSSKVKLTDQRWIGLENFKDLFDSPDLLRVMINTFGMSFMNLFFGTIGTLFLAIMLNETKALWFKKSVQTVSYLPHFVSWVVASSIIRDALSPDGGVINGILMSLKLIDKPILFMGEVKLTWWILTFANIWKSIGWGSIIYLSSMTAVDPQLYEAAEMDGANRFQRIFNVTLPGIMPTIMVLLILNIGNILNGGFEIQYLFRTSLNKEALENFGLYVFNRGIESARYSFATAAGLFNSFINIIFLVSANKIAKKMNQETLF